MPLGYIKIKSFECASESHLYCDTTGSRLVSTLQELNNRMTLLIFFKLNNRINKKTTRQNHHILTIISPSHNRLDINQISLK